MTDEQLVAAAVQAKAGETVKLRKAAQESLARDAPAASRALAKAFPGKAGRDPAVSKKLAALEATKKFPPVMAFARELAARHKLGIPFLCERGEAASALQCLVENGTLRVTGIKPIPDQLGDVTGVTSLELERCQLPDLPVGVRRLANLKSLSVSGARWPAIPDSIAELRELEELSISSATLSKGLGAGLAKLPKLRTLTLWGTQVGELAGLPPSLEQLTVHDGKVDELPGGIAGHPALRELTVRCRWTLSKLAPALGDLGTLEKLELYAPEIDELPREIGKLTKLRQLLLDCDDLAAIPDELCECSALEEIDLQCGAPSLPQGFGKLRNLRRLVLTAYKMKKGLPAGIYELDKLELLGLRYVKLPASEKAALKARWPNAEVNFDYEG
ncbi:MAG TPA: hypothetical protein VIU61_15765 [Kofleriaceae bacterium]